MTINGALMTIISNDSGSPVSWRTSSEMPVTPPSMKSLGSRNALSPKAADSTPSARYMALNK